MILRLNQPQYERHEAVQHPINQTFGVLGYVNHPNFDISFRRGGSPFRITAWYIYISKPKLNRWIRVSPFISRFVGLTSCSLGLKFSISFSQIIVQHPNLCWITYVFVLMIQLYPEVGWYPPGFNIAMENIPFIDRSFTISYLQDGAPKIAKLPYM